MTQYKIHEGSYPSTMDALVPDYLDVVPMNEFENVPMWIEYLSVGDEWSKVAADGVQLRLYSFALSGDDARSRLRVP